MENLHADDIPVLPALIDVVKKGLTGPKVKDGGEEEANNTLGRWQRQKELGGWPPSGAGGTERRPVPLSAQLRCIMSKGVAWVSGGGAAYDRAHEDTDL